jgi:hypothetical protein
MKAELLVCRRIVLSERTFTEIMIWEVPQKVSGSRHSFKYRLALVADGKCLLRYDNEAGKGDHVHRGGAEHEYGFSTIEALLADFFSDVHRMTK